MTSKQFTAVGFKFRGETSSVLESGTITLETEDDNQYDKNAVKVLVDGTHVGYVARENCLTVRKHLNEIKTISLSSKYAASATCLYGI